mmetsp:Transcript_52579/g.87275  ORF Transcript_52579/g.87275 Transcript_52579/m.87275 type:complete len:303 (+) Transcript_52579:3-911(+)
MVYDQSHLPTPPPTLLTGRILGTLVGALISVTTFLYLNHDRENKEWKHRVVAKRAVGYWPPPSADFNWCEPDFVYSPAIAELWNTVTSLLFLVSPVSLWGRTRNWSVRLNLLLIVAIGVGSAAFHATLQYEAQLLDELPMIMYIAHTVALLSRRDVSCPPALWYSSLALSFLLFSTDREHPAHKASRAIMVLCFSGCFIWLAFSLAPLCTQLDQRAGDGYVYTRRYEYAALAVLVAILSWVIDNLGCQTLHNLPFGLPYPQLHALVWHTGMAFVCGSLCHAVLGKQQQHACAIERPPRVQSE